MISTLWSRNAKYYLHAKYYPSWKQKCDFFYSFCYIWKVQKANDQCFYYICFNVFIYLLTLIYVGVVWVNELFLLFYSCLYKFWLATKLKQTKYRWDRQIDNSTSSFISKYSKTFFQTSFFYYSFFYFIISGFYMTIKII